MNVSGATCQNPLDLTALISDAVIPTGCRSGEAQEMLSGLSPTNKN